MSDLAGSQQTKCICQINDNVLFLLPTEAYFLHIITLVLFVGHRSLMAND